MQSRAATTVTRAVSGRWRSVYATDDASLHEDDRHWAMGSSGVETVPLGMMIPLPAGATVTMLPGCRPIVRDAHGRVTVHPNADACAMGALLPTGYARLLAPAYMKNEGASHLPIFGYTAIASLAGKLFVSAMPLDPGGTWDPALYNSPELPSIVGERLEREPANRLLAHHARCATEYGCYTAQNIFYQRNEMAIAVSVACNAQCVGCISEQLDEDMTAPHGRIRFTPTDGEIVAMALPHLETANNAIVSFGQGCEGEPILRARLIARAIAALRARTSRGQLHINTNGSNPRGLKVLIDAGLDSVRVSMFSAVARNHELYYGPRNYGLADMEESLLLGSENGLHTSVNLLTYPGFNDCPSEMNALVEFLRRGKVQMVQLRTLSMDRELLHEKVEFPAERGMGIEVLVKELASRLPGVRLGSKTPFVGRAYAHLS